MNTSAKGRAYEWAYRDELYRRGAQVVVRAAASKGEFDLLAVFPDAVLGIQLKAGMMSCAAAQREFSKLPNAWNCLPRFVHKTKEREFCEHEV